MAPHFCTVIVHLAAAQGLFFSIWELALMLILLVGSAFFSGVETAYFNLSRRQISDMQKSSHKLHHLAARLIAAPRKLLSCLLFGNMVINVLFFASSSVLTVKAGQQIGVVAGAVTAFLCFLVLVLFGEILPKSLAFANSHSVSITAALPTFICLQILKPILFLLRVVIVEPASRLILGPGHKSEPVTADEFKMLIGQVRQRGLISADENRLLTEIIQLGYLKVRDCLEPRVDMIACSVTDSTDKVRELMQAGNLTKLPVYTRSIDNIVGLVHLRHLLLEPDEPLKKLVRRVHFVPEQKTVISLLELFRRTGTDTAIVVDEYGGIAGSIRLEDIAEELIGPIEGADQTEPIEPIGPLEYRLAGDLAIHDWAEVFGIEATDVRFSTIGGLVTSLLGRIPRNGDVARLKGFKFTVEKVARHRIETLILILEPEMSDDV
jgi:CBS domain containing-hemolysin-like protein